MGGESRSSQQHSGRDWWPSGMLGPRPGLKEMNLLCWGLVGGLALARLAVPLWLQLKTGTGSIQILPADFIYFYGIGQIANTHPLAQLYDYSLQLKTFNQIYALHDGAYGPSPYPPFVALFFSLFARVPFGLAFVLWACATLLLYLAGIGILARGIFPGNRLKRSLVLCLALAFSPFAIATLANGQLAAVAVCAIGIALVQERHGRPFLSGLALSILAYKPTLLVLLVPMLLLTRRFRAFSGFMTGTAGLMLVATAFGGIEVWPAYAHFLGLFGRVAALSGQSGLPLWKYVDLGSFVHALPGGRSAVAGAILVLASGAIAAALAVLLWKSARAGGPTQNLAWAATLTWTLLLNVYVPVYDSILAVIAVVLTQGALEELQWTGAEAWMVSLSVVMVAASWETSAFAQSSGVQVLSILLGALGAGQLYLLYRAMRGKSPQAAVAVAAG